MRQPRLRPLEPAERNSYRNNERPTGESVPVGFWVYERYAAAPIESDAPIDRPRRQARLSKRMITTRMTAPHTAISVL
jgi:hypothetical protein